MRAPCKEASGLTCCCAPTVSQVSKLVQYNRVVTHAPAAARARVHAGVGAFAAFDARARLHLLASVATHMLQHHTRRAGGGVYIIGLEVYSIAGRLSTNPRLPVLSVRDLCE